MIDKSARVIDKPLLRFQSLYSISITLTNKMNIAITKVKLPSEPITR